ncbi:putative BAG domain superfamily protein [Plasmopara halstedii]
MDAKTSLEKSRLQTIEQKIKDVQDKLSTRLPAQYRHLAAMVCGIKWKLQVLKFHDAASKIKKVRLELGAFDYRVREQAELLTCYLIDLDGVLSYGNADIQSSRKALVLLVQQQLPLADALKKRSCLLKEFGERVLCGLEGHLKTPQTPVDTGAASKDLHVKPLLQECEDEPNDVQKNDAGEYVVERPIVVKEVEPLEPEAEDVDVVNDVACLSKQSPRLLTNSGPQIMDVDINSLPVWRPYYQLQRRPDGIYLLARINNTNPRNVRVQWNEHNGVLSITGFRLPSQKDIVTSRLSGAPTFGRFEIVEQFPLNLLNMEEATQQVLADGTLQIRMPYYPLQHPRRYQPTSFFQPQDCFVW